MRGRNVAFALLLSMACSAPGAGDDAGIDAVDSGSADSGSVDSGTDDAGRAEHDAGPRLDAAVVDAGIDADAGIAEPPPGVAGDWIWRTPLPQGDLVVAMQSHDGALYALTWSWTLWRTDGDDADWRVWSSISSQLGPDWPGWAQALTIGPDGTFWAGGDGEMIARSEDGGRTWARVPLVGQYGDVRSICAVTADVVIAGGPNLGLLRSADRGASFSEVSIGLADASSCWTDGNDVFVGTDYGYVYRSTDRGATFTRQFSYTGSAITEFAALGDERFAVSQFSILVSPDRGVTWAEAEMPIEARDLSAIGVTGSEVWAGGANWILRRPSGASAFERADPGVEHRVTASATGPDGALMMAGLDGELLIASAGSLRTLVPQHEAIVTDIVFLGPGHFLATTTNGELLESTDGAATIDRRVIESRPYTSLSSVALGAPGEIYLSGWYSALYRSTDGGASFDRLPNPRTWEINLGEIWADATGRVFLREQSADVIWRSTNHGATWSSRSLSGVSGGRGDGIWADGAGTVWAGGAYGVFVSRDWGETWEISEHFSASVTSVFGAAPGQIYATLESGAIVFTLDDGATWTAAREFGSEIYGGFNGVWASGPYDVFVAGARGAVFHSTDRGATWLREATTLGEHAWAIAGSSPTEIALGAHGILTRSPRE